MKRCGRRGRAGGWGYHGLLRAVLDGLYDVGVLHTQHERRLQGIPRRIHLRDVCRHDHLQMPVSGQRAMATAS